jgi:hypothetical protein
MNLVDLRISKLLLLLYILVLFCINLIILPGINCGLYSTIAKSKQAVERTVSIGKLAREEKSRRSTIIRTRKHKNNGAAARNPRLWVEKGAADINLKHEKLLIIVV